jgi:hypothetical protein
VAAGKKGNFSLALDYYRRALKHSCPDKSFKEEYIPLLLKAGSEEEAAAELASCGPAETLAVPLLEAAARLALKRNDDATLDRIFSHENAHIREGNTTLVDIWAEREIHRLCEKGMARAEAEKQLQKALAEGVLPREIDFRMYSQSQNPIDSGIGF